MTYYIDIYINGNGCQMRAEETRVADDCVAGHCSVRFANSYRQICDMFSEICTKKNTTSSKGFHIRLGFTPSTMSRKFYRLSADYDAKHAGSTIILRHGLELFNTICTELLKDEGNKQK